MVEINIMAINRTRISKRVKQKHKKAIRNVIDGLSRKVEIYKQPRKLECPNCYYDKLTDSSTGLCKWTAVEAIQKQLDSGSDTVMYKYFKFIAIQLKRGEWVREEC